MFGQGTINEDTDRHWFQKFRSRDESLENKEICGRPSAIDDDQLKTIIETDSRKITREIAKELNVDQSTIVRHLHQIGKNKKARQVGIEWK